MKERLKRYLRAKKLNLNERKNRVVDSRRESFRSLGFEVSWRRAKTGNNHVHVEPGQKARRELRKALGGIINHWTETAVAWRWSRR
jgi:hypothetical protein